LALAGAPLHPPRQAVALLRRLLGEHVPSLKGEERPAAALAFGQAIGEAVRALPGSPEGLGLLEQACTLFPESGRLAEWLGEALLQAGGGEESRAWLARALRLHRAAQTVRNEATADGGTALHEQLAEHILR